MAYYNKIALLVLNEENDKFLAVQKYKQNVTDDYIMPGGQFDEDTIEECLVAEMKEELNSRLELNSLEYIGEYSDVASGRPDRDVSIRLYRGELLDNPVPSTEIEFLHWIGKNDISDPKISPIIRNKIIPDLIKRNILK